MFLIPLFLTTFLACDKKKTEVEVNDRLDFDGDGVFAEEDCDDLDANTINDMDCDGVVSAEDCNDNDPNTINDMDCDGVVTTEDCDDNDASTYPGAAYNETDNTLCMTDFDGDGYGDDNPAEGVEIGSDCDDTDPALLSNRTDADCDGLSTAEELANEPQGFGIEMGFDMFSTGAVTCHMFRAEDGWSFDEVQDLVGEYENSLDGVMVTAVESGCLPTETEQSWAKCLGFHPSSSDETRPIWLYTNYASVGSLFCSNPDELEYF